MTNQLPRVVIAGRPNVGKSTLFNRLFNKRRAITDSTPGVTRDAIEEICSFYGVPLILIDTGGVKPDADGLFDDIVSERSLSELTKAHLILFLIDVEGITPEDEFLLSSLRSYASKVVLVVNKADIPEKDYLAFQYHSLGLGEPIVISSAHGRNIEWLTDVIIERLGPIMKELREDSSAGENVQNDSVLEVVIAGKPNTGKSTLVNRLAGRDKCVVSDIAGTTRDTVSVEVQHKGQRFRFVDTAGIRRKARVTENVEYYSVNRAIGAMAMADVTVLLVDANEGLSEQDKKIASQAVKKGKTVVMALNKWDEKNPDSERLKKAKDKILFQFPVLDWAPIVPVSALKGYGVSSLLNTIKKANLQQNHRVETSELNRAFADWTDRVPPPVKNNRQYKIRYMTQVSVKPVRFMAFVNRKDNFPEPYRRYITNQIRQDFKFDLVPVIVDLREARR